jgi:hypothetical protein
VVKDRDGGIVRRVVLLDGAGVQVSPVTRFLAHLTDAGYSPNTDEQVLADLDRPQTVRHFRDALRRLVTWIAATHPEMTSLAELHREHAEEFLCWLGTQTSQHTGAPLSVSFRRSIVTLITRFVTETAAWDWDDVPARVLCETH